MFLEKLRFSFFKKNWNVEIPPTPREYTSHHLTEEEHRKNILKSRNQYHTRTLSAREVNIQRKLLTRQNIRVSVLPNDNIYRIRKTQSADELERITSPPVSPVKDVETAAFDSKLKIKRMLSKEDINKSVSRLVTREK